MSAAHNRYYGSQSLVRRDNSEIAAEIEIEIPKLVTVETQLPRSDNRCGSDSLMNPIYIRCYYMMYVKKFF